MESCSISHAEAKAELFLAEINGVSHACFPTWTEVGGLLYNPPDTSQQISGTFMVVWIIVMVLWIGMPLSFTFYLRGGLTIREWDLAWSAGFYHNGR